MQSKNTPDSSTKQYQLSVTATSTCRCWLICPYLLCSRRFWKNKTSALADVPAQHPPATAVLPPHPYDEHLEEIVDDRQRSARFTTSVREGLAAMCRRIDNSSKHDLKILEPMNGDQYEPIDVKHFEKAEATS